jgi:hypothetical protein
VNKETNDVYLGVEQVGEDNGTLDIIDIGVMFQSLK